MALLCLGAVYATAQEPQQAYDSLLKRIERLESAQSTFQTKEKDTVVIVKEVRITEEASNNQEEEQESRAEKGSSKSNMSGRLATIRARATRCCWPPESSFGFRPARAERSNRSISSGTRVFFSSRFRTPQAIFSATVIVGKRA